MTEQTAPLTPKQSRQAEVDAYNTNIDVYTTLRSNLDGNWDSDLVHLKDLDHMEAIRQCPLERIDRLSELLQYEQISFVLKTEIIERNKAKAILDIL